ncbi:hypothetical protein BOVA604_1417 [Bacteroides ovatus]|nr:hypothetical protein BOVA604_1417 [Bacteroides ovatus]
MIPPCAPIRQKKARAKKQKLRLPETELLNVSNGGSSAWI